jgi:hypothetical protein
MSIPGSWRQDDIYVKPGHWSAAWIDTAANADDFQGDLEVRLEDPEPAISGDFTGPAVRRSLALPKGEPRTVEGILYRPFRTVVTKTPNNPNGSVQTTPLAPPNLRCAVSLLPRGGRRSDLTTTLPTTELKNHQAIFCVLAAQPTRYNHYAALDVICAPSAHYSTRDDVHYRMAIAEEGPRAPLPSQAAGWTTIAYLLWDGYDPTKLTEAQQTAMIDWLNWGGQLLVSGPESLTLLERSFLGPHLPARDGGTITLDADALRPLGRWMLPPDPELKPKHPWSAVKLNVDARAEQLEPERSSAGQALVVERRIGRGRVVVTAFSLSEPDALDWPAFDSLLNGCLMRRPQRTFGSNGPTQTLSWGESRVSWLDPRSISNVRYAVRDDGQQILLTNFQNRSGQGFIPEPMSGPGIAAWRDDGPVVKSARELLRKEARIVIPDSRFVIYVVGAYFFVLVPLNWLVFRLIGKPEWAWFAAPLIAVGCSAAVVRLAELDVGFSRSTSEATVVELQPGYDRAHVSRFIAVYNSLGTDYEIRGDDPSTIALPLSAGDNKPGDPSGWRIRRVEKDERDQSAIDGFLVESNSVAFMRAEQMCGLGGAIRCEKAGISRYRITNGTRLGLTDCRISGAATGRIDRLAAGATVEVVVNDGQSGSQSRDTSIHIEGMRSALERPPSDELRLTALTDEDVGGFELSPAPSQVKRKTFVVAHLEYRSAAPTTDIGIRGRHRQQPEP